MNIDDRLRQKAWQENLVVPEEFSRRVEETLGQLSSKRKKPAVWKRHLGAVAAVAAIVFLLPNTSAAMADTMGSLPVIGPLFQVVTVRTYQQGEGKNQILISEPKISQQGEGSGAQEINEEVSAYIDQLIGEYEQTANNQGYFNLDVTWEVVTNTEKWFTLKINSDLVMASGNHQERYYHIDVSSGQRKRLSDLFPQEYDYISAISEELKGQMRQRMETDDRELYWLKGDTQLGSYYFDAIDANQDFYFDDQGQLVIPFDKYEVGPGSTGSPRFVLTTPELYDHLLYHP